MENRFTIVLMLLLPLVSCGQKSKNLNEELTTLYKKTVPLVFDGRRAEMEYRCVA